MEKAPNGRSVSHHGQPKRATSVQHTLAFSEYLLLRSLMTQREKLGDRQQRWAGHLTPTLRVNFTSIGYQLQRPWVSGPPSQSWFDISRRSWDPPTNLGYSITMLEVHELLHCPRSTCSVVKELSRRSFPPFEQKMNTSKALNIWLGVAYTQQGAPQEERLIFPPNDLWKRCVVSEILANSTVSKKIIISMKKGNSTLQGSIWKTVFNTNKIQ